jgi:hypothetical protein
MRHVLPSLLLLGLFATPGAAQTAESTLRLSVDARAEPLSGGRVRMSYRVTNLPGSTSALESFAVLTPVPALAVERPGPATDWVTADRMADEAVAAWAWTDAFPAPGETGPALAYEAEGMPGLVRYRALRYTEIPVVPEADLSDVEETPRFEDANPDAVLGTTVGVVPVPADLSTEQLKLRLVDFLGRACSLGWIESGVCTSLQAKVQPDRLILGAFMAELNAQRGVHVSESAYALLYANAEYLRERL